MRNLSSLIGTALLASAAAVPAAGQAWDEPSFFSPRPGEDVGLYAVRAEGGDWGAAAIWRQSGNINLGVRGGLASGNRVSVGAEFFGPLDLLGPGSGLLVSWVAGLGAAFNGTTALRVPVGISLGVELGTPGAAVLLPYAHPRVALDVRSYDLADGREQTDTDVVFVIDLGADAAVGAALVLRVGASIGTDNTFGAGVAYRLPRRITVR
jgi:hypothetical protein